MSQIQFILSLVGLFFALSFVRAYSEPLHQLRSTVVESGLQELDSVKSTFESWIATGY